MNPKTKQFIQDMKDNYDMNDSAVLYAIRTDSQHDFIMQTQGIGVREATKIIREAEAYLDENVGEGEYA